MIKIMENGILINEVASKRWKIKMATFGGGNSRMIKGKDMEHSTVEMEINSSGNIFMTSFTAMEYTDGLMDQSIMENTNLVKEMVKDITDGQMVKNIGENRRMICNWERASRKRREYCTERHMMKIR